MIRAGERIVFAFKGQRGDVGKNLRCRSLIIGCHFMQRVPSSFCQKFAGKLTLLIRGSWRAASKTSCKL